MPDPIQTFPDQFLAIARQVAKVKYGDASALNKLFNGTSYSQRRKEWFPSDERPFPSRAMARHDFDVLTSCLVAARGADRKPVVDTQAIEELTRAYLAYADRMLQCDARRARGLPARSLPMSAAIGRIERLAVSHGHTLKDLNDRDCFVEILREEMSRSCRFATRHELLRITQALCQALAVNGKFVQDDALRLTYLKASADIAIFALRGMGAGANARRPFLAILDRANNIEMDNFCTVRLASEKIDVLPEATEDYFRILNVDIGDLSPAWLLHEAFPGFLLYEAASNAVKVGVPLAQKSSLLRGQSPEEAIRASVDINLARGYDIDAAFMYVRLAGFLTQAGRLDEARGALEKTRKLAAESVYTWLVLDLVIAELETELLDAEFHRTGTASSLVDYVTHVERTAHFAESCNLPLRAQALRKRLTQSVEKAPILRSSSIANRD